MKRIYTVSLVGVFLVAALLIWSNSADSSTTDRVGNEVVNTSPSPTASRGGARAPGINDPAAFDFSPIKILNRMDTGDIFRALQTGWIEPFPDEVIEIVNQRFTTEKDAHVQFELAMILHRYKRESGTAFLRRIVGDKESVYRESAAEALVLARNIQATGLITEYLENPDESVPLNLLSSLQASMDTRFVESLKKMCVDGSPRSAAYAKTLAMLGDFSASEGLSGGAYNSEPNRNLETKALAYRQKGEPQESWSRELASREIPRTVPGEFIIEAWRTAGPAVARTGVEQAIVQLAEEQRRNNQAYVQHVEAIRSGQKEWSVFGSDPLRQELAIKAVQLIGEWGKADSAEAIYQFAAAYLGGKYSEGGLEHLIIAAAQADPSEYEARLASLGVSPVSIKTAEAIRLLNPVPRQYVPRQFPKYVSVKIPGEE